MWASHASRGQRNGGLTIIAKRAVSNEMLKIWKIVAAGAGLWAVLRLFYGWKWGQGARAASIICHTCTRHSFTCCTHSKHGSEPADKRARRFLETQDLGRENSRPARRAYVALPGAASTPHYCRLLGCMQFHAIAI